jgi:hypothetical protein
MCSVYAAYDASPNAELKKSDHAGNSTGKIKNSDFGCHSPQAA